MTTLYYHGLYNPLLLIYYLVPGKIPTIYIYDLILIILNGFSALGIFYLLKANKISIRNAEIGSYLFLTTGAIYTQYWANPMYIYYLPLFIWGLWSINYFLETKKIYPFIIFLSPIIYTNFFFVPYISILYFIFILILLFDLKQKKSILSRLKYFIKFCYGYIVGLLIGAFYLIPIYFLIDQSTRKSSNINVDELLKLNPESVLTLTTNGFFAGISIIGVIAIYWQLKNSQKDKNFYYLAIFLLVTVVVGGYMYALNLFQYTNYKLIIYNIPLYYLLFFRHIQKERIKFKIIDGLIILSIIIVIIINQYKVNYNQVFSNNLEFDNWIFIVMFGLGLIIITLMIKGKKRKVIVPLIVISIFLSISYYGSFIDHQEMERIVPTAKAKENYKKLNPNPNSLYRTYTGETNRSFAMNSYNPEFFASLMNKNYQKFFKDYNVTNEFHGERAVSKNVFDNQNLQKYLGIKYFCNLNNLCTKLDQEVNPIIYGVEQSDVYNQKDIQKATSNQKSLALNRGIFIDKEMNKEYDNRSNELTYNQANYALSNFTDVEEIHKIPVPYKMMGGQLIISFGVSNAEQIRTYSETTLLTIDGIDNALNGDTQKDPVFKYVIDVSEDINQIELTVPPESLWLLKDIEITFSTQEDITEKQMSIIEPQNVVVNSNQNISFDLNYKENGVLATTIPYDEGFKVFVDNKEMEKILINGVFLGIEVPQGIHHFKIEYQIKGFNLGMGISLAGLMLLVLTVILEYYGTKKKI